MPASSSRAEPLADRRRGQADAPAELGEAQARVLLQGLDQLAIGGVELLIRKSWRHDSFDRHCTGRCDAGKLHDMATRLPRGRRWRASAPARVLRRQRDLPLPRAGVRGAAVRPRRAARDRLAADRRGGARAVRLAAAVAAAARPARCSRWARVLAVMNCCFYLAIDRLPLGTVAAIEFLPVIALAALGARTGATPPRSRSRWPACTC